MKKRVLVFPCGTEIGLEIYRSLRSSQYFDLIGASSIDDHGRFDYEHYISDVPFVDAGDFIKCIRSIVDNHRIDFIFPAHDSVVLKLAEHSDEINAQIVTSSLETCRVARSKLKTYDLFEGVIEVPRRYASVEEMPIPAFLKPDVGQGSKGVLKVQNPEDARLALSKDPSLMILEYLPGKEYTIDCFTNKDGELLYCQARTRSRISNGISVNSYPMNNPEFLQIAKRVNKKLRLRGAWFFQLKRNAKDELVLLEIAPRVAGTMGLSRALGVNLALMSLFDRTEKVDQIIANKYDVEIDRALGSSYKTSLKYTDIYIEFEDTLVDTVGHVDPMLMNFLYQCSNENKNVYLVVKSKHNLDSEMDRVHINKGIFKDIILVDHYIGAYDKIEPGSVIISDRVKERENLKRVSDCTVLDRDTIEFLIRR